ncbi:hypothetical protein FJ434_22825 [Mesorhizobium sp. B2-5-13]|uniref:hypothetical protein n=1 Tax=unclassified Mesorhizobium TaxID=325217 RepID=UPI00112A3CCC|nr:MULTISPECIES: hypothetical protein [unclassified Mesorhizobium]TPJ38874.1 hypothetical protein FJ432_21245 [Mesorhizobium sp. B2-6-5]TPJ79446.1 hypothetical protein FJ434_22825 [Mesorhizobium sp. B2-5-13]TPK46264.1 hypothetical protein FJ560_19290 [Mesorhizobium sp. B2-5-5]
MDVAIDDLGKTFDAKKPELVERLKQWFDNETTSIDDLISTSAPSGTGGSVVSARPAIDSKRVVDTTVITEEILGIELPPEIIKPGGYNDFQEMVDHLVPLLRRVYTKDLKVKKPLVKAAA